MSWLDWQLGKVSFFSPSWKSWPSGWLLIQPKGHPLFFFLSLKTLSSLSLIFSHYFYVFCDRRIITLFIGRKEAKPKVAWGFFFFILSIFLLWVTTTPMKFLICVGVGGSMVVLMESINHAIIIHLVFLDHYCCCIFVSFLLLDLVDCSKSSII